MLRIFDKPAGVTTHTSLSEDERRRIYYDPNDGLLEYLASRAGQVFFPAHRLDIGTCGAIVATDNADEAAKLGVAFEKREVEKHYHFLTDRKPRKTFKSGDRIESHIMRVKGGAGRGTKYVSIAPTSIEPLNAVTTIEFVREVSGFSLWRAQPETGKPHQIRLHAEACGLPILGDVEHEGTPFPTLALHSTQISFEIDGRNQLAWSPVPRWFDNMNLLEKPRLIAWLAAIDRRERLHRCLESLGLAKPESLRWIHGEGDPLRLDQLGAVRHLHWYDKEFRGEDGRDIEQLMAAWLPEDERKTWYLQVHGKRGAAGQHAAKEEIVLADSKLPERWIGAEENLKFHFRRDSGLSSGLFLDQRANRRWVSQNSSGKRVLNLFSYTGGFSVAAASAGATQVVTVDVSAKFNEWAKENFVLNRLDPLLPQFEFRTMDARSYLAWAKKKGLNFDLVICDPPSFSRGESGVFRIETDFEALLESCLAVTASTGCVLFSTNFEGISEAELFKRASKSSPAAGSRSKIEISRTPTQDWDFELPREPRLAKSFFAKLVDRS